MLTVALAGSALAQTVASEAVPQPMAPNAVGPPASADVKPAPETATPPCTDCRGGEAGTPTSSDTVIMTKDGKTIVPRTLMREQADFSLNGRSAMSPASTVAS
jgi:hypothetical protein